jgi:hypothetical protein
MLSREQPGANYRIKDDTQISDLTARTQHVFGREVEVVRNQLPAPSHSPAGRHRRFPGSAHAAR